MCVMQKEKEAAFIFNFQCLLLIEKLCILRVMEQWNIIWNWFFSVGKRTSSHNNFDMSERLEKSSYFLSSSPFYVHGLENQSMECRFWQAELLYGPEYNSQFKYMGKKMENYLEQLKR